MNESKATRYQRLSRRARAAGALSALAVLCAIALTPAGRVLADAVRGYMPGSSSFVSWSVPLVMFVTPMVVAVQAATLPAALYLALSVEDAYGRGARSVEGVLGAEVQATLMTLVAVLASAALVHASAAVGGYMWWLIAACGVAVLFAAALHVAPALFAAAGKTRRLPRESLVVALSDLAHRAGAPTARIEEWVVPPGSSMTALVTGAGQGRRILVSSEVVRQWADEEVTVVVAHELAHHVHRDLWRTVGLDVALLSGALLVTDLCVRFGGTRLGIDGAADLAALPFMALVVAVVWFAGTPLRHAQSRRHESRADAFALGMTGHADAFAAVIRRLGARHLAEERPSDLTRWFYHRHPPVAERLALAQAYSRRPRPESNAAAS